MTSLVLRLLLERIQSRQYRGFNLADPLNVSFWKNLPSRWEESQARGKFLQDDISKRGVTKQLPGAF